MSFMKTIICAEYQKESILRNTAVRQGGTAFGTDVKSLSNLLRTDEEGMILQEMKLSALLKDHAGDFPIYSRMFIYPAFIQEILSFAKECALYQISPEELPSSDPQKKELRGIIRMALTLPLGEKGMNARKETVKENLRRKGNVFLYPGFETEPFNYHFRKELEELFPYVKTPEYTPEKKLMYAMNPRQELEAAAQHICLTGEPCIIVLTSVTSQLPVLKEVFGRYGIPFSTTSETYQPNVRSVFCRLLEFALDKDFGSFIAALKDDAFPVFFPDHLIPFMEQTMTGFDTDEQMTVTVRKSIFSDEADRYEKKSEQIRTMMKKISSEREMLLSAAEPKDMLKAAFAVLRKSPFLNDPNELTAAMKIRSAVSDIIDLINSEEDLRFFTAAIQNLSFTASISVTDFCTVTDLRHPAEPAVNTYVIGCSGQNYPGVPTKTGLFDERYLSEAEAYPSAGKRFSIYKEQLAWIGKSASGTVYYSYPTNDYQGREIQPAFEIEAMFGKDAGQKWPLLELKPAGTSPHTLTAETAEKLFRESDGAVHGSISRIERWFQCPYSYFIQSGLKIRKVEAAGSDNASIGTIQHALAEEAVKRYGKNYASLSEEEIAAFLKPSFDALRKLNPNNAELNGLIEERMIRGLTNALAYLNVYEAHTSFEPTYAEKSFGRPAEDEDAEIIPGVRLRGTIDRLDTCRELMRVVDYKSSLHTLSETKLKAGLQLQLLTYLIMAEKSEKKTPVGAYYFSFKGDSLSVPAAKASAKAVTDTDWSEEAEQERILSLHQLKGWTFEDRFTELDQGEKFISPRTIYDYDLAKECILSLYEYFRSSLLSGEISLDPVEGACTFCDFRSICRYHGETRKAVPVVMGDTPLKKEKEGKK